ncbi:MAG: hemin uptake protein HemP [Pseudomonadota bacterium]
MSGGEVATPAPAPARRPVCEAGAEAGAPGMLDARELTAGASVVRIRLDAQVYTLRITRQGKLILTK